MNQTATQVATDQFQWITKLPWLLLVVFAVPFVIAAYRAKIYPTRLWLLLLIGSLVGSLVAVFYPPAVTILGLFDAAIMSIAAIDFLLLYLSTNRGIQVSRTLPRTCSIGVRLPARSQSKTERP